MHRRSESHSPSRKRMRLSSPTFDDQVGELSQDDINIFDRLDAQLSQSHADTSNLDHTSYTVNPARPLVVEDDENPFRTVNPCQTTMGIDTPQTKRIHAVFMNASKVERTIESSQCADEPSQPPGEASSEVDYAAWFNSDSSSSFVGFSTAAAAAALPGFQRPSFNGGSEKSLFIPSAAALQEAEEKMRKWQQDADLTDQAPTYVKPESSHFTRAASPSQALFSSAKNTFSSIQTPKTPTPASLFRSANADPASTRSHSSFQNLGNNRQTKPFKSPLVKSTQAILSHQQVSTPSISSPLRDRHPSVTAPSQTATAMSPLRPSSVINHVMAQKPLGFTPKHSSATTRPKFVTPFKPDRKYGIAKAFTIEYIKPPQTPSNPRTIVNRIYPPSAPSPQPQKQNGNRRVFNLDPPPGRQTLATSGLRPQSYSTKELEHMGINVEELGQVNLRTAPFYAFTTRSRFPPNPSDPPFCLVLGRTAVLEELHARGCTLAKQAWVDNNWSLILWKLAGMVALDPLSERDPFRNRWCWPEVIRQFLYRYERDLNSSSRPPLRLITTRDASAGSPMVFCISDIISPAGGAKDDAAPAQTYPELEVTDGWYRLRARIDAPLARAVRKGKIKIGRKIAVAGAKLSAERKEGSEILEAYGSNVLLLTGNSTHMAPWHAKLGFQREPLVATLNSLTADGGNVAVMMLTVIKAYPIAYIEFVENADGRKHTKGPHDAREEVKLSAQWKMKRELHASRLWSEYEKRKDKLLDYAERLEQRTGSKFNPRPDDGPPDKIYDLYDSLQEDAEVATSIMSSIDHEEAGWLARHIQEKAVQDRDGASREIEQELESICPPRDVKAFCVIVVRDTRTFKYSSKRTAQVTVWDVPGISAPESLTQSPFVPGQRYLVTNLVPTQASAWMDHSSDGEVYLNTRKNSKWTLIG